MKAIIKLDKENVERTYEIYSWKIDVNVLQFIISEKEEKSGVSGVITILMEGNDMDLLKRILHGPRKMGIAGEIDRLLEAEKDD